MGPGKSKHHGCASHSVPHKAYHNTHLTTPIDDAFVLLWCDASIGTEESMTDDQLTLFELARIVNKNRQLVHTFNDVNACEEFIQNVNNVCLIVSGSMGEQLVPKIHHLNQIHSIYVFCWNKAKHEQWAANYNKIRGVYTEIKTISERLKEIIFARPTSDFDLLSLDVISGDITTPTTDKKELALIYAQLIRTILLNQDDIELAKQDMIDFCRSEYTNEHHVRLIDEIEQDYQNHDPVWWYTRNGFLQRIVNRALLTHDLHILWSMRLFIANLDRHIGRVPVKRASSSDSFKLYIGQSIYREDFDRIRMNRGGLICINQFLSANADRGVALAFAEQNSSANNNELLPVLLQIHIDLSAQSNVPFANIGAISQFIHEKEHLISLCSVYRIERIEQLQDPPYIWYIDLTLINRDDSQLIDLTQHVQEDALSELIDLAILGKLIAETVDQFKFTIKLFERALGGPKYNRIRAIMQHYNMGIIHYALNEPDKSVEEYRQTLINVRHFLPDTARHDDIGLAPIYSHMGLSYQQQNKPNHAFEHAFRAFKIAFQASNDMKERSAIISSCYINLGYILEQQEKFSQALSYYEQALALRLEYLSKRHPDIIAVQANIEALQAKHNDHV